MKTVLAAIACLLIAGCEFRSPLEGAREDSDAHPAKARDFPVEVFSDTKPARPYDLIEIVKGDSLEDLKYHARRVGADAIILVGADAQAIAWKTAPAK